MPVETKIQVYMCPINNLRSEIYENLANHKFLGPSAPMATIQGEILLNKQKGILKQTKFH